MKIIVTGSLGYISKPLTKELVQKRHEVTVISSSPKRKAEIEALGAKAAIGTMEDVNFLTDTFRGADAVYCMIDPYGNLADPNNSASAIIARADAVANNYVQAIERSGVKRVVYLSSIGADMKKDNGIIIVHHNAENTLNGLPSNVNISFIRPAAFYKNLLGFVNTTKNQDAIAASYGGDDMVIWVSNIDIADVIIEELESLETGRKVRYVASEELTCNAVAGILGTAIGKPHLKWVKISDEQQLNGYKAFGMSESFALKLVEMNASIHSGKFWEDYNRNKLNLGKTKLEEFTKEFAAVYNQSK